MAGVAATLRRMKAWSVIASGLIVAASIALSGRWHAFAPEPGGLGIVRLDRWTGAMALCVLDIATVKGNTLAGAKMTCEPIP